MNYLPMNTLGAQEVSPWVVQFGIYLPGVDPANGYKVSVLISHENDQFLQAAEPAEVVQTPSLDAAHGNFWSGQINLQTGAKPPGSTAFGTSGKYVYRYLIYPPTGNAIDFIIDPFAREAGVGRISAITVQPEKVFAFSSNETVWKTPALSDAIIYELMIGEFRGDIDRAIKLLPYLADLGVNCIEVMPMSNVQYAAEWGYDPIGHFCVVERFGGMSKFQEFVDAAHRNNLAVIVDSVYGHLGDDFAYYQLYSALPNLANPFIGPFTSAPKDGQSADYSKTLTQDYYYSVNQYWLDHFHIDGFRYDDVTEYWDGPTGVGYANLVYTTYQFIKSKVGAVDHYQRFFDAAGNINLIQVGEYLTDQSPTTILYGSYSTGAWQDTMLGFAQSCAAGASGAIADLGGALGLANYPISFTLNTDTLPKTGIQYIENHDHQRFLCNFGTIPFGDGSVPTDSIVQKGDRPNNWFKVQPYLIALLTAKGTPMLVEGQEICQDYWIPSQGYARILLDRPVIWNYFYDDIGQATIRLVRKLTSIRKAGVQFRTGDHYFINDDNTFNSKGLLAFYRQSGTTFSLIVVNFTNQDQSTAYTFPIPGNYTEQIEGKQNLPSVVTAAPTPITIPSNYGCIWTNI
jgi:1,4-alpha-glucan branching enzyme